MYLSSPISLFPDNAFKTPPPECQASSRSKSAVTSAGVVKRVGGLPPVCKEKAPHFLHATNDPVYPSMWLKYSIFPCEISASLKNPLPTQPPCHMDVIVFQNCCQMLTLNNVNKVLKTNNMNRDMLKLKNCSASTTLFDCFLCGYYSYPKAFLISNH